MPVRPRFCVLAVVVALGCRDARPTTSVVRRFTDLSARGSDAPTVARECAACHRAQYERWRRSQHAAAQRPFDPARDPAPPEANVRARAVIGVAPLWQALAETSGGRVQTFDPAFDPARREWFSVFAEARRPEEWGHWRQRGMNWNSQCAWCHTTDFVKGYDPRTDTWRSSWSAAGVACASCHGAMEGHAARPTERGAWRAHTTDVCASCHARREELTGAFRPGERFEDHFKLTLADAPGGWHPDGRVADEDFEYNSLSMSRMGHRGVTCLDCHEPHGGGLRAPIDRDQLCLTCHGAPGARGAPTIHAEAHTHHPAASAGARCVNCHMPEATFMQRDRRRDHGFTIPDPTLTREMGVPNACDGCHGDRPSGWSEQHTNVWFGAPMDRPARHRARIIARARRRDESVLPELARGAASEVIDAWRAALVALLGQWADSPVARPVLVRALGDTSPLVQAAAVRALALDADAQRELVALRHAPSRLVRLEAAWATRGDLARDPAARAEVRRWLDLTCDQPAGALRRSDLALIESDPAEARVWARRAAEWDPSGPSLHALGQVLHATGDLGGAIDAFGNAMRADSRDAAHPYARALLFAEAGRTAEAVVDLERAVALDPRFARAQYNLGLARAALGRLESALEALQQAEALDSVSPDAPWAAGTVHLRMGRGDLAREAARRALARDPSHAGARALLREAEAVSGASASGPRPR